MVTDDDIGAFPVDRLLVFYPEKYPRNNCACVNDEAAKPVDVFIPLVLPRKEV